MKKRILGYLFAASGIIFAGGCSDFLEIKNYGDPVESWEDESDVDKAIAGLYEFTIAEEVSCRGMFWLECANDNIVPGRTRAPADAIKEFKMDASNNEDAKENWAKMYQYVARANNILSMVPTMDKLTDSYKTRSLGIAYFFRGLYMLWIAPYYGDNGPNGGIPIVLDTTNTGDIDSPRPASVLMNYDQIISDMRNAGEMLPLFSQLPSELYGYPHKAAAWAFGARAALYAAQYDASYYDIVLEFCNNIENLTGSDKRELFDDGSANPFRNLWRKEQNFGSEYIFSMLGNAVEGPKFHGVSFHNGGYSIINTWGYFQPTADLLEAFETGDTRREATILLPGEEITFVGNTFKLGENSYKIQTGSNFTWAITSTSGMYFRKFMSPWEAVDCLGKDVNPSGNDMSNTLGTCLIRYADVLLMKAEALIWTQGEGNSEARDILNKIRKRARLPENSTATKAQLKNERRVELAFEFQPSRFVDIVRWGDDVEIFSKPTYGIASERNTTTNEVTITDWRVDMNVNRDYKPGINHVFPIPETAFTGTANLVQNVGY